jgi:hypothetical protein
MSRSLFGGTIHVLLVDHDPAMPNVVDMFQRLNYRVSTATSVLDALQVRVWEIFFLYRHSSHHPAAATSLKSSHLSLMLVPWALLNLFTI